VCVCLCVRARCFLWTGLDLFSSGGSILYWSVVVCPFPGLRGGGGYGGCVFKRVSKIALGNMVRSSFN
jgi:hypothetical protein